MMYCHDMTTTKLFGETTSSEKIVEEKVICREIVKQIMDFGVNQRQILTLIYLLCLELESIDDMKILANTLKTVKPDLFLASPEELAGE
jgi:hypothetical protein